MSNFTQRIQIFDSPISVKDSIDRLEAVLNQKGIKIFSRINHGQAAKDVEMKLADIEVLIFGDPKVGTLLMQENPALAYELPLKVVAYESTEGTKMAYTKLEVLFEPYDLKENAETIHKMSMFMQNLIKTVIE